MSGPDPAVAAVRRAVRAVLPVDGVVMVACSGGADSLALLLATIFEARSPKSPALKVIGVVVDHGLQHDSADHTERVVAQMGELGADETASVRVTVDPGPRGIEAGAREARYAAIGEIARHFGASSVLLGHTRDDQAETVLLGLARGSGGRSLAGMRSAFFDDGVQFVRPLLKISREETEAACRATGIEFWSDPHNIDQRFLRARLRHVVLPILEAELGGGVAPALARTARSLREDVDALDDLAADWFGLRRAPEGLIVEELGQLPAAIRTRVLRLLALEAGALGGELNRGHIDEMDELVTDWRGQDWVDLPGHLRAVRRDGRIAIDPG